MAVYTVLQALAVAFYPGVAVMLSGDAPDLLPSPPAQWWVFVLLQCFSALPFCSLAVNWHRFMLVGDEAEGLVRLRIDATVWRYLGNVSLLVLLIMPAIGVVIFVGVKASSAAIEVAADVAVSSFILSFLIMLLPVLVAMWLPILVGLVIMQRLMIKLPAIALDRRDYGFGDAWADSKGSSLRLAGFILMAMASTYVIGFLASAPLTLLAGGLGSGEILAQLLRASGHLAINWIGWIIAINAITTLYGVFVEGRSI